MEIDPSDLVTLGTVGKPYGLQGWFYWEGRTDLLDQGLFRSCYIRKKFAQSPEVSLGLEPKELLLKKNRNARKNQELFPREQPWETEGRPRQTPRVTSTWQPLKITGCQWHGTLIIGRIESAQNRSQIEVWRGAEIAVAQQELVSIPQRGIFYWKDLIGRSIQSSDGKDLGLVKSIYNAGASDIAVIKGESLGLECPLVEEFIDLPAISVDQAGPLVLRLTFNQLEPLLELFDQVSVNPRTIESIEGGGSL